jgi:hypothetical protein
VKPLPLLLIVLVLAGCLGDGRGPPPETQASSASSPVSGSDTEAQVEKVEWDRTLVPFAGVCANATVRSLCAQRGLGPLFAVLPLKSKNATHASLTFTWTASSPLTHELDVALVASQACGVDCVDWRNATILVNWTTGPSPLVLDAPLPPAPPGNDTLVVVRRPQLVPTVIPVRAWASTQQSFRLEGEIHGGMA